MFDLIILEGEQLLRFESSEDSGAYTIVYDIFEASFISSKGNLSTKVWDAMAIWWLCIAQE